MEKPGWNDVGGVAAGSGAYIDFGPRTGRWEGKGRVDGGLRRCEPSRAEPSRERDERGNAIFLPLLFLHLFSRNIELEAEKFRREFFSNFPPGFNIGRKQAALTLFPAIFHIAPDSISNSKSPRIKKYPSSTLPSFLIPLYYALESFLPRKKKKKKISASFSLFYQRPEKTLDSLQKRESINFKDRDPLSLYCLRAISQDNDPRVLCKRLSLFFQGTRRGGVKQLFSFVEIERGVLS